MKKSLDTAYVYFEWQDDLLICTYKKGLRINLDMAKEIIRTRHDFTAGKPHFVLILNQGVISMDKNAREYLVTDDGVRGIVAAAYVHGTPFGNFLINFFMLVNKPPMPVRLFSRKEDAIKWLNKFRT